MARGLSKQDFVIGAIYRVGLRRGLARDVLEALLVKRARLTMRSAHALVGHWLSSEPYRLARK